MAIIVGKAESILICLVTVAPQGFAPPVHDAGAVAGMMIGFGASTVVLVAGSSLAFAVAGLLALLAVVVTYFTPLRRYNLNEPPADERPAVAAK